jgi:hypothetical protein
MKWDGAMSFVRSDLRRSLTELFLDFELVQGAVAGLRLLADHLWIPDDDNERGGRLRKPRSCS